MSIVKQHSLRKPLIALGGAAVIAVAAAVLLLASATFGTVRAQSAGDLNDLEIAHVAYTADLIDIRYAHLALSKSKNPAVHAFAQTMIRDHSAVNDKALLELVIN